MLNWSSWRPNLLLAITCWSANLPWYRYDFNMLKPCYLHRLHWAPIDSLPLFLSWKIIVDFWRSQPWGNWWCTGNSWPNSLILLIEMHADCIPPSPTHNSPLPTMWFIQDEKSSEALAFFPKMTPTFYSLSPGTGNRALNNASWPHCCNSYTHEEILKVHYKHFYPCGAFKLSFYGHTLPASGMHFLTSAMVNDSADSKVIFL